MDNPSETYNARFCRTRLPLLLFSLILSAILLPLPPADGEEESALPPLFSSGEYAGMSYLDICWPIAFARRTENTSFTVIGPCCSAKEPDAEFSAVLPFWLTTHSPSSGTARMLFPLCGSALDIFGYRKLDVFLFPLYWRGQTGNGADTGFLWPVFRAGNSGGEWKYHLFPFYMNTIRNGTRFHYSVLWPLFSWEISTHPENKGTGWMAWPFFGFEDFSPSVGWCTAWPLFSVVSNRRGGWRVHAPWPLIVWSGNLPEPDSFTARILPFSLNRRPEGMFDLYFWPLFSLRSGNGRREFRTLDLLPVPEWPAIRRNWAPLWTIYARFESEDFLREDYCLGLYRETVSKGKTTRTLFHFLHF